MKNYKLTPYGVRVKMCCASCVHASIMNEESRKCGLTEAYKHPEDMCIAWEVKPKLMNAGKGDWIVRSKEDILKIQQRKLESGELAINGNRLNK